MAYDVRLATRITNGVDRRLRMLALARSQPLSHVLVSLLDQVLPPADELAALLGNSQPDAAEHAEAVALVGHLPGDRFPGCDRRA
jgi:hypothetical protein